ncbi:flagellar assembly protein FliH [Lederbergia sp. NSJ-179]|uniref:flagellar assembly protein FliH n=1 Tax=Lederbergia sp. NSJ-179 TaxID=2931402 RepID=UPI001FD1C2E5|nr:flagellar assembly protein FliH [Lederbergia sp. NSJ-179]MCJ7839639.1 flagellar assembly protein FliH [Lederbergia sp. NSJ-179]
MSRLFKSNKRQDQKENPKMIRIKPIQIENKEQNGAAKPLNHFEEENQIIAKANSKAAILLNEAKQQAEGLIADIKKQQNQWEQEKKALTQEAYEEGLQIGLNEGRQQGYNEYKRELEQAKQIVDQSKIAYEEYIHRSEQDILELAIASAERIIRYSLEEDHDKFIPLVKAALKEVRNCKEIQIYVHPSQYELLLSEKQEIEAVFPKNVECFIYPDTDLEEFACQIESETGRVDANITSQLHELKEKLLEILLGEQS